MSPPIANRSPLLLPALFFLLVISIVEGVIFAYNAKIDSDQRLQALAFAADLRSRAERELNGVLYLTRGLAGYFSVRHESLEREEILGILRVAYETTPSVRNFGVAVGYKLRYVYPHERNEAAIGLDYRELEHQWPDVKRAIEERRPVLSDNVALLQGGTAFVYRDPIYIDNDYWGLLSTVIDAEPLLNSMFAQQERDGRHTFAVRSRRGDTPVVLWGAPEVFEAPEAVTLSSERRWDYAVKPREGNAHWLPIFVLRIFGWILALVAALGAYTTLLHRRQKRGQRVGDSTSTPE